MITGASGFIGKALVKFYLSRKYNLILVCPELPKSLKLDQNLKCYHIQGYTHDIDFEKCLFEIPLPDMIINLGGVSSVAGSENDFEQDFQRTVYGATRLYNWARYNCPQAKIFTISSAAVYGSSNANFLAENDITNPTSLYGMNRVILEKLSIEFASLFDQKITILRVFSAYGIGNKKQIFWDLCEKFASNNFAELSGTGEEVRDWINICHIVGIIHNLFENVENPGRIINIGTGRGVKVKEAATLVQNAWEKYTSQRTQIKFSGQVRLNDPKSLVSDTKLLRKLDSTTEIALKDGIDEYVKWYLASQNEFL